MRNGFRIADTDCHQMEAPGMWQEYIDPAFADRAPRREKVDGRNAMVVEGKALVSEGKYPFSTPDFLAAIARGMERFKRIRETHYSAEARLQDMDEYGVDLQILYPTVGGQLLGREFDDPELLAACCRAYNDWSANYCEASPDRLRWAAMLPVQDAALAVEEIERTSGLGCAGFYVRPNPIGSRNLHDPANESIWAAIERSQRPVCIHDSGSPHLPSFGDRMETHTSGHIVAHPFEAMVAMMGLIWFGVVERFPALRVVHVEADAGWTPYWLQRMEQHYDFSGNAEHPELRLRPTEYFDRNFFVAARGDERTLPAAVELIGDDTLLFNTDYPHPDGTFPWGIEQMTEQPIPDSSKRKILWENAARAFGFDASIANP